MKNIQQLNQTNTKGYYITTFFIVLLTTTFLALNLVPLLTKTGNSNAESTDVTVEIDPVLSLRLSKDEINLNPSPIPEGTFVYDTLSAIVDTNNKTGYTLTMNSETEEAALIQEDEETKIPSLTSDVTITSENQSNFTMNRWGYALTSTLSDSGTTFNKIPALSTPDTIAESEGPIAGHATPVSFATRVDTSLPSGTYNNTITFTAIANSVSPTFGGIMYMQDMTASICEAETTPTKEATESTTIHTNNTNLVPEATLIDSRDGETYTVRKLADGNCWMSQNLRLQLSTSKPLTPSDSDVVTSWTPGLDSQTTVGISWGDGGNATDVNKARSYVDTTNTEYGGYYNWYAATASTGTYEMSALGQKALSSICPKGWQLPESYYSINKSYDVLVNVYYGTDNYTAHNGTMLSSPFDFPLSGFYNEYEINDELDHAYLWTSAAKGPYTAYRMAVGSSHVDPQWEANKLNGLSVRCVSRGPQQTINFDSSEADSGIASASADLGSNLDLSYYSSLFKKDGYTLKQWKDQDGNLYDATSTSVNVNPGNNKTITLTAVWDKLPPTFSGITKMQEMTASICAAETTPTKNVTQSTIYHSNDTNLVPEATLTDTRDNNTYTVKKLADGNCWMTQNLRLVGSRTLTSADSDVSSNWTLPAASTSGFSSYTAANVGPVNSTYGNGAYYSWTAATAGTGTSSVTSGDAPSSVCPKGWRLPPNSGNKSYYNLITTIYGQTTRSQLTAQPLQFAFGGSYNSSSFSNGDSYGAYWSSTANSSASAYYLHLDSSGVYPQNYYNRYSGFSVRCVAR